MPHRLEDLNTWSPAGDTILGGCGTFWNIVEPLGSQTSLEDVGHGGWTLMEGGFSVSVQPWSKVRCPAATMKSLLRPP